MNLLLPLVCLQLVSAASAHARDWPNWLGPDLNGISTESGWEDHGKEQPVWSRSLGLGYSMPSIAEGRLYTLGHDPEQSLDTIFCLDKDSGETLWTHELSSKIWDTFHGGGTLTAPAVYGGLVIVSQREGNLFCFEAESGERIWSFNLAEELSVRPPFHGFAGSPLILDDVIFLLFGTLVVALDLDQGEVLWESARFKQTFSPLVLPWTVHGRDILAAYTGDGLLLLDPEDGSTLGSHPWDPGGNGVNCSTPITMGDRVFVSSAYNKGGALLRVLPDWSLEELWTTKKMRNKVNASVLWEGHLYGFDESMLKCLDLDGTELWRKRGLGMGCLSAADGRLLILSSKGDLIIADATPEEFRERFRTKVLAEGSYWTPPVLSDGRIYCRNSLGEMVCLDHRPGEDAAVRDR